MIRFCSVSYTNTFLQLRTQEALQTMVPWSKLSGPHRFPKGTKTSEYM